MFVSYIHEKYLAQDWINGEVINDALVEPVNAARSFFKKRGYDHEWVYRLWEGIEERFYSWKKEYGQLPVKNPLEANSAIDYEAVPYQCAGYGITCYADLLAQRIIPDKYEYLKAPIKYKLEWILYAVVLLEAASRGDEQGAHKAHQRLVKYKLTANKNALNEVKEGFREGGRKAAEQSQKDALQMRNQIKILAKRLLESGKDKRNLSSLIAPKVHRTSEQVRTHLQALRILSPRKKRK